jgi:hypothetical protein
VCKSVCVFQIFLVLNNVISSFRVCSDTNMHSVSLFFTCLVLCNKGSLLHLSKLFLYFPEITDPNDASYRFVSCQNLRNQTVRDSVSVGKWRVYRYFLGPSYNSEVLLIPCGCW